MRAEVGSLNTVDLLPVMTAMLSDLAWDSQLEVNTAEATPVELELRHRQCVAGMSGGALFLGRPVSVSCGDVLRVKLSCPNLRAQKRPRRHKDPTNHGFWNSPVLSLRTRKQDPDVHVACDCALCPSKHLFAA